MNQENLTTRHQTIAEAVNSPMENQLMDTKIMTFSCYANEVPTFVDTELIRLYGNLYSSLAHFRIEGKDHNLSTYVVRKGGRIITLFLFRHDGAQIRVINQVISIDEADISRFAAYVFATYALVSVILFEYIQTNVSKLPFPYQRVNISENIVLSLPGSAEEYLASLGKNTRRNAKRCKIKLLKDFPSFNFEIVEKGQVSEQTIRDIIELNRARMADKSKQSLLDEIQTGRNIRLVAEYGFVGVAKIDGRICAGCIGFQTGSNYFLGVVAHDSSYKDYWLGTLCCYLTICESIARGGREFHFLWGEYAYKYTLLGVKRDLDKVTIYRSYTHILRNSDLALATAWEAYRRHAMLWLDKTRRADTLLARCVVTSINFVRSLKRFRHRVFKLKSAENLPPRQKNNPADGQR
jgi:hypothetical protein